MFHSQEEVEEDEDEQIVGWYGGSNKEAGEGRVIDVKDLISFKQP